LVSIRYGLDVLRSGPDLRQLPDRLPDAAHMVSRKLRSLGGRQHGLNVEPDRLADQDAGRALGANSYPVRHDLREPLRRPHFAPNTTQMIQMSRENVIKINTGLLVFALSSLGGTIFWGGQIFEKLASLENQLKRLESIESRVIVLESEINYLKRAK